MLGLPTGHISSSSFSPTRSVGIQVVTVDSR